MNTFNINQNLKDRMQARVHTFSGNDSQIPLTCLPGLKQTFLSPKGLKKLFTRFNECGGEWGFCAS